MLFEIKYFVLSWGMPLEAPLSDTCESFFQHTKKYWQTWVKHCAVPPLYQAEVIRSALALKLHQFEDTGAIIAAATTSLPESDQSGRTWDYRYCWLRDAYFTLSALRYLGQFQEMESFVEYLRNIAETSSQTRLQPVYGLSGEGHLPEINLNHWNGYKGNKPVRIGNDAYTHIQNDIYGEMILSISPLFLDERFVLDSDIPSRTLLNKLIGQIIQSVEEPDAGLWEFRAKTQVHTFSLLMHWLGANEAHKIAQIHNFDQLERKCLSIMTKTSEIIEKRCWSNKLNCYTQAIDGKYLDASLLLMINTGYLALDNPRAKMHLRGLEKGLSSSNGFIYRYNHADDFGKPEVTFTVCGFWFIEALARLGYNKKAKKLFDQYLKCANSLGLFSEDIASDSMEQWGNFPQTYSHVGLINAAFRVAQIGDLL